MKIFSRLESWAEAVGRIWGSYWLLIVASFCIVLSIVLKWVESPFSRNIKGITFSLFHDPGLIPHVSLLSFGVAGGVVLFAGLLLRPLSIGFLAAAAAVLLTMFALVPAHIAFQQPEMLRRLVEESQAMPLINAFTREYLPQNYGAPEVIPKQFILTSGWGRFMAACDYLGLGWYLFGLGSLLASFYVLSRWRGPRGSAALAMFGLPWLGLAIVLAPAAIGQHYFTRGAEQKAEGLNLDAIASFQKAMRWDVWHAQDIYLYSIIGELQRASGVAEDSPERHINRALALRRSGQYEQAIFELDYAAKSGGALGEAARHEASRTHVAFGLALYQAGGFGSAVTNWQLATAKDPTNVYGLTYLARGFFDIANYDSTIATANDVIKITRDHPALLANAYSLAADAYAKLGQPSQARDYYSLSIAADPILNYWALTRLAGE